MVDKPFSVQADARKDGIQLGHRFVDYLFSTPWFNQPGEISHIQLDGTVAGYLARLSEAQYQHHLVEGFSSDGDPRKTYLVNLDYAFTQTATLETSVTNAGEWRVFNPEDEHAILSRPSFSAEERALRWRACQSGSLAASAQLWHEREEAIKWGKDRCETPVEQAAFRAGIALAYGNYVAPHPQDLHLTNLGTQAAARQKSRLAPELEQEAYLQEWLPAWRRGFVNIWEALLLGTLTWEEMVSRMALMN